MTCAHSVVLPGLLALVCDLDEGHAGAHHDPKAGAWEFVENGDDATLIIPPLSHPHQNCKCTVETLPKVDGRKIPPWWIAQRLDEVFGPTPPRLFFDLEPYVQIPTGPWQPPL